MGRKIPARKHHGVRDPLKQAADRFALIKDKIDNPPEKEDYQKLSYNFKQFIKNKDDAKLGKKLKRIADNNAGDKPENYSGKSHLHNKVLPNIRQIQNEDDEDYLHRVNRITRESIQESKFETKYGVEVIRNEKTGEIKLKKKPVDELQALMKKAKKNKNRPQKPEVLKEEDKKKIVKEMLKKKKADKKKIIDQDNLKPDIIPFGEVVHAPPTLSAPRRCKKTDDVVRPGKKNLLLHNVIKDNSNTTTQKHTTALPKKDVKLKTLSTTSRQLFEEKQKNVVELYRQLKKARMNNAVPS